jgi:glycosyltransferase involved in cell wall biosynthesis
MVCTIHSEVIALEEPVLTPEIKKYIAIRPEIKKYIVDDFNVDSNLVEVVYNPIDNIRFKLGPEQHRVKKRILFVGTIDYLRKNTIQDLVNTTKENNEELWIVGKKNDTYLDDIF